MSKIDDLVPEDLGTDREKEIGQHIGYRYDVNLVPDYDRLTPFLKKYLETMEWKDLNWLEDVHMGYEEDRPAVFDRNINGWVTVPEDMDLPDNQQDRDMIARELLVKFQMSQRHPMVILEENYGKFWLEDCGLWRWICKGTRPIGIEPKNLHLRRKVRIEKKIVPVSELICWFFFF